jgi:predicted transcriptional regulator
MIDHGPHAALLSDITGFMKARVILTGAEMDIFTLLDGSPGTLSGLVKRTGFNRRSLERLFDALAGLGFLGKNDGVYSLTEKGELLSSKRTGMGCVGRSLLHGKERNAGQT